MIFTLPCMLRQIIWRMSLKMRNCELKSELLVRQSMQKQICDMLANHHHLNECYLRLNAKQMAELFYKVLENKQPIIDISDWTQACSKKKFAKSEREQICELLAAIILQYACIIKQLTYVQISSILTLHDDILLENE